MRVCVGHGWLDCHGTERSFPKCKRIATRKQALHDRAVFVYVGMEVVINLCCAQVGFPQRDPTRLKLALDNSHSVLWIRSIRRSRWAKQGQLLGFARATSDGALSATIWDVAVSRFALPRLCLPRFTYSLLGRTPCVSSDLKLTCCLHVWLK